MLKILAIDDNSDNLISLKAIINDTFPGAVVLTSLNGPKGIELAIVNNPDVILLDIIMPQMDGFEVCRLLKLDERVSEIPVVFLTALKGDNENRIKALEVGAEGFISKPIDEPELIAQIRAMVKIRAANEQKRNEKERLEILIAERTHELEIELTERKLAEEAVRKTKNHFSALIDKAPDGVVLLSAEGRFLFASPSALKLFGYSGDEYLSSNPNDLTYPEDLPYVLSELEKMLHNPSYSPTIQYRFASKDGSWRWIESTFSNMLSNPDIQAIIINFRDIHERKLTSELLKKSEEQLRGIFENLQDAYFQADLSGKLTLVSPSALKMFGYRSIDELLGLMAEKLHFNPKERHSLISTLHAEGKIKDYVSQGIKKDGSVFWISLNIQWLWSRDGQIIGTEGMVRDITERINTERALKESEEKYRTMVDLLPDPVIIHEGEKFVFANAAALKTVEADSYEQLIERPLMEYVHPDFRDVSLSRIKEIYSTNQPSTFSKEKFITLKDEVIDVEVIGIPVMYMGKPAIQTIIRDITERKKAEDVLKESEERFRHISSSISDISYSCETDLDGSSNINWLYGAVEEITGYTTQELIAMKCWGKLVLDEDFPIFKSCILGVVPGQSKACQLRLKKKDGSMVWIQATAECVKGTNDKNLNIVCGALVDISDRKLAEQALQKSEAQFREFFEKAADAIFIAEIESGIIVDANEAASRLMLHPHNELVGINQAELHPQAKKDYSTDSFKWHKEQVKNKLKSNAVENRVVRADGVEVPVEILASEVDFHGKHCLMGTFRDITDRKRAEDKLHENVARLELAMNTAKMSWWEMDRTTGLVVFEKRKAEMLGYSPEKFKHYTDFMALVHPEDYEKAMNAMRSHLDGSWDKYEVEYRIKMVSGEYKWFYDIGSVTKRDSQGNPLIISGLVLDISERKLTEEALREREQLFRSLFNASPDAVVLIDPNHPTCSWPIVDCNEASCRMNGYTREEMIGQSIDLLNITPEKPKDRIAYYNELKEKGIIHMETSHRHKDGHIFPIEVSTSLVVTGRYEMVLGIDRDITERKQAESALKNSEDRYRQFVSQVSEGVCRYECDQPIDISLSVEDQVDFIYDHMFIAECNDAFLKIYGIKDRKGVIGKGHLYFHGGRYNPVNRRALGMFIKNGYHIENAMTEEANCQGQMIHISHNSLGIIENNHLVRIWGTQIDITEKIRADRVQQVLYTISNATFTSNDLPELIEIISNELARLLDSTNFFIAFYDEPSKMLSTVFEKGDKDKIDSWPAEKSLTGYVIKHQKSLLANEADITKLCESGEIEIVGIASKIWMGVPLSVNKKVIGAIVVQSYDNPEAFNEKDKLMLEFVSHQICISIERKKAEQELNTALVKAQESDRLKSAFLANMSHEIRTPLNSIIGFSELMADPDFDSSQQTEFAKIIINSGNSLLSIISDIMDFSKIEAGQIKVNKFPFVTQRLISDLLREYSLVAQGKGIELRIDPQNPKEDVWITGDEYRLKQVLVNLVGNAIKFTKEGFVELGIEATNDFIQFRVNDTGIGIPEEYHSEIFERFRQVESSNSRMYGGNGLGLAISKSLVEIMGGKIWLESVKGKGSTFYFTVPK